MNNIFDTIKGNFKNGSSLIQLIYINVGVFVAVELMKIVLSLFKIETGMFFSHLAVTADLHSLIFQKPWSILTYMFMHVDLFHIFFNMICLFWFGKIFLEYLNGKQLVAVYLISGLGGAALFLAAYNIFPLFQEKIVGSTMVGASGSIMGVMVAATMKAPNYPIRLMLVGQVKLRTMAIVMIAISLYSVTSHNAGGEFAHIGGALMGYLYIVMLNKGNDLSRPITSMINKIVNLFSGKKRIKVHKSNKYQKAKTDAQYNQEKKANNKNIDIILDKIKRSGYNSLSETEKKQLFEQSKNI